MVIEWLRFDVSPEARERFVQQDAEIWTTALSEYGGFLGKEVWISPDNPREVITVVHWESFDQWYSIPKDQLEAVEARFSEAMGQNTYQLLESKAYQVRKFAQVPAC
ncbi:MAG: TIGR03792 family protein [Cyanobacteriota bacterium]